MNQPTRSGKKILYINDNQSSRLLILQKANLSSHFFSQSLIGRKRQSLKILLEIETLALFD